MKCKTILFSVIILLGICIGVEATAGIVFDRPTEKLLAGHNIAQAHLYFDDVEVPPMYCTIDKEHITIHGQAIPKTDRTAKPTPANSVRLEWHDEKNAVIYRLTKILPSKHFISSKHDWVVSPIDPHPQGLDTART